MKPDGSPAVLTGMATLIADLAALDCRAAALALAAHNVPLGRHLLSRAAMLLRLRAIEPNLSRPSAILDC
jgi:hypothetical protein